MKMERKCKTVYGKTQSEANEKADDVRAAMRKCHATG